MKCSEEMRILRSPFVPFSFDKIMKQLSKSQKGHWPPWCLKSQTDVPEDGACMWCAFFKPHAPLFLTSQLPKSQFYILKPENSPSSPLFRGGKTYSYIYIFENANLMGFFFILKVWFMHLNTMEKWDRFLLRWTSKHPLHFWISAVSLKFSWVSLGDRMFWLASNGVDWTYT